MLNLIFLLFGEGGWGVGRGGGKKQSESENISFNKLLQLNSWTIYFILCYNFLSTRMWKCHLYILFWFSALFWKRMILVYIIMFNMFKIAARNMFEKEWFYCTLFSLFTIAARNMFNGVRNSPRVGCVPFHFVKWFSFNVVIFGLLVWYWSSGRISCKIMWYF